MSTHAPDDLLAAAVDGRLSQDDRDLLEAHLRICARCRDEVAAAGRARGALDALPDELTPSIDVAAAVAARIADGDPAAASRPAATPRHTPAAPRWYRAAGIVAAAAAIALAVLVIPDLTRDGGSSGDSRALEAASQDAGTSAAAQQGPVGARAPVLELVSTDFDHGSLDALGREAPRAAGATTGPTLTSPPLGASQPSEDEALACLGAGAGGAIFAGARVERLLLASFEGTPAYVGVVVTGPSDDPATILVVAVAVDGCRLLDSA